MTKKGPKPEQKSYSDLIALSVVLPFVIYIGTRSKFGCASYRWYMDKLRIYIVAILKFTMAATSNWAIAIHIALLDYMTMQKSPCKFSWLRTFLVIRVMLLNWKKKLLLQLCPGGAVFVLNYPAWNVMHVFAVFASSGLCETGKPY